MLTPVALSLAGLWLDERLGITPALSVFGALAGFVTVFATTMLRGRHEMSRQAAARPALPRVEPAPDVEPSWVLERDLGGMDFDLDQPAASL